MSGSDYELYIDARLLWIDSVIVYCFQYSMTPFSVSYPWSNKIWPNIAYRSGFFVQCPPFYSWEDPSEPTWIKKWLYRKMMRKLNRTAISLYFRFPRIRRPIMINVRCQSVTQTNVSLKSWIRRNLKEQHFLSCLYRSLIVFLNSGLVWSFMPLSILLSKWHIRSLDALGSNRYYKSRTLTLLIWLLHLLTRSIRSKAGSSSTDSSRNKEHSST